MFRAKLLLSETDPDTETFADPYRYGYVPRRREIFKKTKNVFLIAITNLLKCCGFFGSIATNFFQTQHYKILNLITTAQSVFDNI